MFLILKILMMRSLIIKSSGLLSYKPFMYVANVVDSINKGNSFSKLVEDFSVKKNVNYVKISQK